MTSIETISNEYLASINGLAQKIGNDLSSVREAYQDLWYTLSREEQEQVLNEAVIDPGAVLKYSSASNDAAISNEPPSKFSWFTRSQLNLFTVDSLRAADKPAKATPAKKQPQQQQETTTSQVPIVVQQELAKECARIKQSQQENTNLLNKIKSKVPIGLLKPAAANEEKQSLVDSSKQQSTAPPSAAKILKPKTPPPPPPPTVNEKRGLLAAAAVDVESDHSDDIPKTGFDFLDNW
ncbi:uncharacterized protein C1orf198 homolog [Nilaparvata lugens]|uniref:uncharacterized protein C1orf198 homolog n=1 Tax=Nilaparvata lugens TaxID=108931 RepID=UPI00193D804F|nr:uncharacterized protein C1orf198 homolog [Nilaparvata lugens]